jgi:hypothetical protein
MEVLTTVVVREWDRKFMKNAAHVTICLLALSVLCSKSAVQESCLTNSGPPLLTPASVHFGKGGGVATIGVSVSLGCSWSVETGTGFIGTSNVQGNLQLNVGPNPNLAPRSGSVPVTSTPFGGSSIESVTQDAATGDFSISATPSSNSVVQGATSSYQLTVSRTGGFSGGVAFSVSGLPSGVKASFGNFTNCCGTMTVSATQTASLGTFQSVTISGTNGNVTHTVIVSLTVLPSTSSLSVSLGGTGSGSVTSSPAGITCASGTCSANFASNLTVTLSATASADSVLLTWGGACSGNGPCVVSMSQNQSVTATFALSCLQSIPVFSDFNGDGKTDLLWLQSDGRSFVQLANGNGNFANYFETNQSNNWGPNPRLYLGDFNGDGKTDLLWLQSDNNSFVQLANANGNFANYFETNQSNSWGANPKLFTKLGPWSGCFVP